MTNQIGAWEIRKDDGPNRMRASRVDLEKELEDWICKDPDLVQAGLTIIGRQVHIDANRVVLDLIALDPQGTWVVVEIKKGTLSRDSVAQAIDYAACLASMSEEEILKTVKPQDLGQVKDLHNLLKERDALDSLEPVNRELSIVIVGTDRRPELDRMVDFLSERFGFPLTVITFHVVSTHDDNLVLIRELNEPEQAGFRELYKTSSSPTLKDLEQKAEQNGIGSMFRILREVAEEMNLHTRLWKTSLMFTPQTNKTRCLYTIWIDPIDSKIKVYLAAGAFTEFFQIPKDKVEKILGSDGWRYMEEEEAKKFAAGLIELLKVDNLNND